MTVVASKVACTWSRIITISPISLASCIESNVSPTTSGLIWVAKWRNICLFTLMNREKVIANEGKNIMNLVHPTGQKAVMMIVRIRAREACLWGRPPLTDLQNSETSNNLVTW